MSSPENQFEKNIEEKLVECHVCRQIFDSTKSFCRVKIPGSKNQPPTEYLAGQCPSCKTIDTTLFDWSKKEIEKGKKIRRNQTNSSFFGNKYPDEEQVH